MHLKDIEAAITIASGCVRDAMAKLEEVSATIAEEDHKISVVKELEKGNALNHMQEEIRTLKAELAVRYAEG